MARTRKRKKRTHGAGSISTKRGRSIIQWTDLDGRRKTRSYPDPESARIALAKATAEVAQGRPGNIDKQSAGPSSTLGERAIPWLAGRVAHESHYQDVNRWHNHWQPIVGTLTPNQVTVGVLKKAFGTLRAKGLSNTTVRLCAHLLSAFYGDLVEEGAAEMNPLRMLSKKTRREFLKPAHDPKKVPYIRDPLDVERIYTHLLQSNVSVAVAYAIGALAGLRTSEVSALDWKNVNMGARTITVEKQVQNRRGRPKEFHSEDGTSDVKDGEVRIVPLSDSLYPILLDQRMRTGGVGLICPPTGVGQRMLKRSIQFLHMRTMGKHLRLALVALGIEPMIWYQATRHTFASQWVLHGGTLEKLQEMMGHSSIVVTERYAHLQPGRFTDADRSRVQIQMVESRPAEVVVAAAANTNGRMN